LTTDGLRDAETGYLENNRSSSHRDRHAERQGVVENHPATFASSVRQGAVRRKKAGHIPNHAKIRSEETDMANQKDLQATVIRG